MIMMMVIHKWITLTFLFIFSFPFLYLCTKLGQMKVHEDHIKVNGTTSINVTFNN